MNSDEQFSEPRDLVDEIVTAILRQGALGPKFPALKKLEPWLRMLGADKPYHVETVVMTHDWFLSFLNDGDLLEHITLKPWEEITDDMRVRHARYQVESFVEENAGARDEYLAVHEIKSRNGKTAVVAFICTAADPPSIERFLGAWPTLDGFWSDYRVSNIDPDFLPSYEEILRMWEHYRP